MGVILVDHRKRCPLCGGATIAEVCYVCDGERRIADLVCAACSSSGEIRYCAKCGADYWAAVQQARRDAGGSAGERSR